MALFSRFLRHESPVVADPADRRESELVRAAQAGETRAFEDLVRLHTNRVLNYLLQMTRHRQDAEDLCQQTFLKAYRNLQRVDPNRPLIAWLLTIARRSALNHFRSQKQWTELSPETHSPEATPAHQAEASEQIGGLWERARQLLSARDFEVLWLRLAEELSVEETATVTGLTESHVKILVYRARQSLLKGMTAP